MPRRERAYVQKVKGLGTSLFRDARICLAQCIDSDPRALYHTHCSLSMSNYSRFVLDGRFKLRLADA